MAWRDLPAALIGRAVSCDDWPIACSATARSRWLLLSASTSALRPCLVILEYSKICPPNPFFFSLCCIKIKHEADQWISGDTHLSACLDAAKQPKLLEK